MNDGINVLSLFDGISCGKIALDRVGVKVNRYFASEIDEDAIAISKKNHNDIIRLGDVTKWRQCDYKFGWNSYNDYKKHMESLYKHYGGEYGERDEDYWRKLIGK